MDYKEIFLFWENFGTLAKKRLDVASVLTKTLGCGKNKQGFWKSHPREKLGDSSIAAITIDQEDGKRMQAKPPNNCYQK